MSKFHLITMLSSSLLCSACATGTIKPSYVSPTQYQSLNCAQLHGEYARLKDYLNNGVEPEKRNAVGLGVGLGGIANLLGQQDAIEQAALFKNCPIQHPRPKTGS
jgi:hypothetical protein